MSEQLPPDPSGLRIGDGPWNVLAALGSGDPERIREALAAQREQFKAMFGCYLEDCVETCPECMDVKCPLWLAWRDDLRSDDDAVATATRQRLRDEHTTAEAPCTACGGAGCNMFFCYAEGA